MNTNAPELGNHHPFTHAGPAPPPLPDDFWNHYREDLGRDQVEDPHEPPPTQNLVTSRIDLPNLLDGNEMVLDEGLSAQLWCAPLRLINFN